MSKMFPFITATWNPLAGECSHRCVGCWARALAERHGWSKYQGQPRIDPKQISRRFKAGDFVFVQDMSDLFAEDVPHEVILRVLEQIAESPDAKFLLLTKNPRRYLEFMRPFDVIPSNCVLGATIESNRTNPRLGNAPDRAGRILAMATLREIMEIREKSRRSTYELFVSIEPILNFDLYSFRRVLDLQIRPESVAVGMDNYNNGFPEPSLLKTRLLIRGLESMGIKVIRKTLREAAGK